MNELEKKSSKETPDEGYATGTPSDILLNYAEGHYQKVYSDNGEMVFLEKHTQSTLRIPEESLYYMEILHGYEFLKD